MMTMISWIPRGGFAVFRGLTKLLPFLNQVYSVLQILLLHRVKGILIAFTMLQAPISGDRRILSG